MNIESQSNKNIQPASSPDDFSFDDFDFKPITSGLGFHQPKASTEIKPVFTERTIPNLVPNLTKPAVKKEMNVYQNDLSLFYGQQNQSPVAEVQEVIKEEKFYRLAGKAQRVSAYLLDLMIVLGVVGIVLTLMARTISMKLIDMWSAFPQEITPLAGILFVGFYLIYFSVFEKATQSTIGKNAFGLRVVNEQNQILSLPSLILRTIISLCSFLSLGLFSHFDLQNKVTHSKVIRKD
jgi:uncharacterized RDD family membrane protein YckC